MTPAYNKSGPWRQGSPDEDRSLVLEISMAILHGCQCPSCSNRRCTAALMARRRGCTCPVSVWPLTAGTLPSLPSPSTPPHLCQVAAAKYSWKPGFLGEAGVRGKLGATIASTHLEATMPGPLISGLAAGVDRRDCGGPGPAAARAPPEEGRMSRCLQDLAETGE